jgi:hypothetical protein
MPDTLIATPGTNSIGQVDEILDPKLKKVLNRLVREMELTVEKVAANHAAPTEFPLPTEETSMERLLLTRFKNLPAPTKQIAGLKAQSRLAASAAIRRRRFGDLSAVNLKEARSVGAQVRGLEVPVGVRLSREALLSVAGTAVTTEVVAPTLPKLSLRVHKVRCVDETGGRFAEAAGDDEIDLAGVAVDETGDTHAVPKFRVGSSFDDGESVTFSPPRVFTTFDIREGTTYPKSYFVTLVLAEVDQGNLSEFVLKLVAKVKEKVIAYLAAAVGGALGSIGGPLGTVIGLAIGFVVGKVFELLISVWNDDVFTPITVKVDIASPNARWPGNKKDSPETITTFTGHDGKYTVTTDWQLTP